MGKKWILVIIHSCDVKKETPYLFSSKLFLHYSWDHCMVFRHPGQRHVHKLHVLDLEYILHTWKTSILS